MKYQFPKFCLKCFEIAATLKNILSAAIFQNVFQIVPRVPANQKKKKKIYNLMSSLGYAKLSDWIKKDL